MKIPKSLQIEPPSSSILDAQTNIKKYGVTALTARSESAQHEVMGPMLGLDAWPKPRHS